MSPPNATPWSGLALKSPDIRFHAAVLVVAAATVLVLLTRVMLVPFPVIVALASVMAVGVRWVGTPVVVFLFIASLLVVTGGHFLGAIPVGEPLSRTEFLLCVSVLFYVGQHYRLMRVLEWRQRQQDHPDFPDGPSTRQAPGFGIGGLAATAFFAALAARWSLPYFYMGRAMSDDFRLQYVLVGFLFAVLVGGVVLFLGPFAVRMLTRGSMNELEAEMALNEELYRELRADMKRLVR